MSNHLLLPCVIWLAHTVTMLATDKANVSYPAPNLYRSCIQVDKGSRNCGSENKVSIFLVHIILLYHIERERESIG